MNDESVPVGDRYQGFPDGFFTRLDTDTLDTDTKERFTNESAQSSRPARTAPAQCSGLAVGHRSTPSPRSGSERLSGQDRKCEDLREDDHAEAGGIRRLMPARVRQCSQ